MQKQNNKPMRIVSHATKYDSILPYSIRRLLMHAYCQNFIDLLVIDLGNSHLKRQIIRM